jgi:hypothetical protein
MWKRGGWRAQKCLWNRPRNLLTEQQVREKPARKNRRKQGVKEEKRGRSLKKSLKILLTENGGVKDTPRRASYCLPPRSTFRRSSPIRTPDKVSEEYRCR